MKNNQTNREKGMEFDSENETYEQHLQKWREGRGCSRKKLRFENRKKAKKEAIRLTKTLRNGRLSAYKCDFCDYFHVGHNWTSQASVRLKQAKAELNS